MHCLFWYIVRRPSRHSYMYGDELITPSKVRYIRAVKEQLLVGITDLLNDLNILHTLSAGALIEYERKQPIEHDIDIDIRIRMEDVPKWEIFCSNASNEEHNGYNIRFDDRFTSPYSQHRNGLQGYLVKFKNEQNLREYPQIRLYIDLVYEHVETVWSWQDYDVSWNELREIEWLNVKTYAPSKADTERLLSSEYGKNWRVPDVPRSVLNDWINSIRRCPYIPWNEKKMCKRNCQYNGL